LAEDSAIMGKVVIESLSDWLANQGDHSFEEYGGFEKLNECVGGYDAVKTYHVKRMHRVRDIDYVCNIRGHLVNTQTCEYIGLCYFDYLEPFLEQAPAYTHENIWVKIRR